MENNVDKNSLSLRNIMEEIGYECIIPTNVHEDNDSAIKVANNPRSHDRMKHIKLKYHLTRDAIQDKQILVKKISTSKQIADVFTKALARKEHEKFTNRQMFIVEKHSQEM